MKKLLLLFIFCIHLQAHANDSAVDIAFMNLTGYSTRNVFLIDVDNPEAEALQYTQNFDLGLCLEESDGSDEAFAACEAIAYPPYLGLWQFSIEPRYHDPHRFVLENLETGELIQIYDYECSYIDNCAFRLSPDGRWLVFGQQAGLMLLDLSQFGEAEAVFLADTQASRTSWLNETQLLYWEEVLKRYFVYDTETALHYPLEAVLDRETLTISTEGAAGLESPPEPVELVEIPDEIRGFAYIWDWRSDGTVLYGSENTVSFWDGESSEDLFSIPGEYDEATDRGGWHIRQLLWSEDETALLAGFWELNAYHELNHYWLYEMESGELREVFAGDGAQWLR